MDQRGFCGHGFTGGRCHNQSALRPKPTGVTPTVAIPSAASVSLYTFLFLVYLKSGTSLGLCHRQANCGQRGLRNTPACSSGRTGTVTVSRENSTPLGAQILWTVRVLHPLNRNTGSVATVVVRGALLGWRCPSKRGLCVGGPEGRPRPAAHQPCDRHHFPERAKRGAATELLSPACERSSRHLEQCPAGSKGTPSTRDTVL